MEKRPSCAAGADGEGGGLKGASAFAARCPLAQAASANIIINPFRIAAALRAPKEPKRAPQKWGAPTLASILGPGAPGSSVEIHEPIPPAR